MGGKFSLCLLKDPAACLEGLWRRIPGHITLTFASTVVLTMVTHLYAFTHKLTNHDDLIALFFSDYGTMSGRWLLPTVLRLDGDFSMPWLIGMLCAVCLAGTACFSVAALRIRRPVWCILTAALLVTFPAVTASINYMFSADAYFFSLLLAVFGAWSAVRLGWWGSAIGAVAFTLSLGIYQAYLPAGAVLIVGALLLETLDGERTFRDLFLKGLRLAGTLAVGVGLYLFIVRMTASDIGLTDYQGIDQMGQISLSALPRLVVTSYKKYFHLFWRNEWKLHFGFLKYAFCVTGIGVTALGAAVLWMRRLDWARTVLTLALAAAYPLAGALIYVMVPDGYVHTLMVYGMVYILVFPISLVEYAQPVLRERAPRSLQAVVGWVVLVTVALASYSYLIVDNNAYLKVDLSMQQCSAYSNRLLERIESCDGFEPNMPVVLIGNEIEDEQLNPTPALDDIIIVGTINLGQFRTSYTYAHYLRNYLGFPNIIYLSGTETALRYSKMDEVKKMPRYPQEGSVQVIDGLAVVKLN